MKNCNFFRNNTFSKKNATFVLQRNKNFSSKEFEFVKSQLGKAATQKINLFQVNRLEFHLREFRFTFI